MKHSLFLKVIIKHDVPMLVKEKATSEKFMLLTFSLISQTHLSLNLSVNNCLFYQPISLCILAKVIPPLLGGVTAH